VANRMVPLPVTLSDLEDHFCCLKPIYLTYTSEIQCVLSTACVHMNRNAYVTCTFNYFSKMKDFSRSQPVTCTLNMVMSRKRCQIKSETTNRKWCIAYRIQATPKTFKAIPTASLLNVIFTRDAIYASSVFAVIACPSVRPSVWLSVCYELYRNG